MKKLLFLSFFLFSFFISQSQKLMYAVSFPNAIHHEAHIELTVTHLAEGPAIFKMSRSSPGRYATHEFGKNVYDVAAKDATGKSILVKRVDGDIYAVSYTHLTLPTNREV